MNLEADINWIQKEIAKIKDPDLIKVFKTILQYREKKASEDALDFFYPRPLMKKQKEGQNRTMKSEENMANGSRN